MRPGVNTSLSQELRSYMRRLQRVERAISRMPYSGEPSVGDTTPPTTSAIGVTTTATTATVTWTTNEPSTTQIEYGTTNGLGIGSTPSKYIMLAGWSSPTPQQMVDNKALLESMPYQGVTIELAGLSDSVMLSTPISLSAMRTFLAPLNGVVWTHCVHNWVQVVCRQPNGANTFTGDTQWGIVAQNFANLAQVIAEHPFLEGIAFDTEQYYGSMWAGTDETGSYNRGKQIMQAMVAVNPDIKIELYCGPMWAQITSRPAGHEGVFTAGMVAGAIGTNAKVSEGGEFYGLETPAEYASFAAAMKDSTRSYIPVPDRPYWSGIMRASFGIYTSQSGYADTPAELQQRLTDALANADEHVWIYDEQKSWTGTGSRSIAQPYTRPLIDSTMVAAAAASAAAAPALPPSAPPYKGATKTTTINGSYVTSHSQQITGLAASTLYYYRVRSVDSSGNLGTGPINSFTTGAVGDTTPPTVSARVATPGATTVAITWTTDKNADSQVEWGLTASYGNLTALDTSAVTSHIVNISGLTADTTYHYRILTRDTSGNRTTTSDGTFTTTASSLFSSQFTGSNGDAWPAGFTITYPSDTGFSPGTADIQSNAGRLLTASGGIPYGNTYRAQSTAADEDAEILVKWRPNDVSAEGYFGFVLRGPSSMPTPFATKMGITLWFEPYWQYWYVFYGESQTVLDEGGFTFSGGAFYWTRFQVNGTTVRFKHWADGASEPSTWTSESTLSFTGDGKFIMVSQNGESMSAIGIIVDELTFASL